MSSIRAVFIRHIIIIFYVYFISLLTYMNTHVCIVFSFGLDETLNWYCSIVWVTFCSFWYAVCVYPAFLHPPFYCVWLENKTLFNTHDVSVKVCNGLRMLAELERLKVWAKLFIFSASGSSMASSAAWVCDRWVADHAWCAGLHMKQINNTLSCCVISAHPTIDSLVHRCMWMCHCALLSSYNEGEGWTWQHL